MTSSSDFTARIIITIPADLLVIARSIARALDTDSGGADSYVPTRSEPDRLDDDGNIVSSTAPATWVADTLCSPGFAAQVPYLLAHPAALHAAVAADYAARWPDLIQPTLAECEAFCAGAVLTTAPPPSIE